MLKLVLSFALSATALVAAVPPEPALRCDLVPGWSQQGESRTYTPDNLFEYMDGNAEGYLIYGFVKMTGISCTKGPVNLAIDISDMGDADSAYGMFTANRDPRRPSQKLGMGGQIARRRAIFAKGQYYIEVAANPEGDHTAVLQEWTSALEKIEEGTSAPPAAISWFPAENLKSLRMVPESVLGLRLLKRGYAAEYDYGKAFLVLESSSEAAAQVMQKLRVRFGETTPAKVADEAFQLNDAYLGRMCVFRKGRYIGGYANVADGQETAALAAALAGNIP
jgi:hypothetical protein